MVDFIKFLEKQVWTEKSIHLTISYEFTLALYLIVYMMLPVILGTQIKLSTLILLLVQWFIWECYNTNQQHWVWNEFAVR